LHTVRSAGPWIVLSADPLDARIPYACPVVLDTSRPYWSEPRVADPPGPARRDWLLVTVVVAAATIETFAREQLVWSGVSLVVTVGAACLLPWRRVHPLLVVALAFGTMSAVEVVSLVRGVE